MRPRQLGSYSIVRRLAVGGMGEIFLARQGADGPLVVVKTLLDGGQIDDNRRRMFLSEARVATLLDHPGIVKILEVGEAEGSPFIAMEYVEGETISALVRACLRQRRHSPWPFVEVVAECARALHYAHHRTDAAGQPLHIVHRDISPQNLMVRRDGRVKVVDFGIAKVSGSDVHTTTGVIKGKLPYMSPEQLQARPVDARSDLFSLGVVLWEATVGRRLHGDRTDVEILRAVLENRIPRPSDQVPGFHRGLESIIGVALAWDVGARFATGNDLADALQVLLAGLPAGERVALGPWVDGLVGPEIEERTRAVESELDGRPTVTSAAASEPTVSATPRSRPVDRPERRPQPAAAAQPVEDPGRRRVLRRGWLAALAVACGVAAAWILTQPSPRPSSEQAAEVDASEQVSAPPPTAAAPDPGRPPARVSLPDPRLDALGASPAPVAEALFCGSGTPVTCGSRSVCPAHATCDLGGRCTCQQGHVALDCKGHPCGAGLKNPCTYPDWWCAPHLPGSCGPRNFTVQCETSTCPSHAVCSSDGCRCEPGYVEVTCGGSPCAGQCQYPDWMCVTR